MCLCAGGPDIGKICVAFSRMLIPLVHRLDGKLDLLILCAVNTAGVYPEVV